MPAGQYAAFECSLDNLMKTIDEAYQGWLPNSGFKRAQGPEFERYDQHFIPGDSSSPFNYLIPVIEA